MTFPYNDDEKMWMKHAENLRKRAYEYELMAHKSWLKRLGQKARTKEMMQGYYETKEILEKRRKEEDPFKNFPSLEYECCGLS